MLKTGLSLKYFGISDIGLVRGKNEDAWAAFAKQNLFILADGMGGHRGGEIASQLAVDTLVSIFSEKYTSEKEVLKFMKMAFESVNKAIYMKSRQEEALQGMGTTLIALCIEEESAYYAHVGDSRLYLFRKGLKPLTRDHSLLAELVAKEGEEMGSKKIAACKHVLTKAIGTHPQVEPTFQHLPIQSGDFLMLTSDGLTNYLSEEEIEHVMQIGGEKKESLEAIGGHLVDLAKSHGGGDNITLILIAINGMES